MQPIRERVSGVAGVKWISMCEQANQLTQLNGTPLAQPLSAVRSSIGDHDQNGKLDLMVQFDRASLISLLQAGNATLTIAGQLMDGVGFAGGDTISVVH